MPDLPVDFAAALEETVVRPAWFIYLDILGDPIRVTSSGYEVFFPPETADEDLAGFTFSAIDASVIEVGEVVHKEGGSDSVKVSLSGILGLDQDVLDAITDRANWQGRVVRIWMGVRDETGEFQGDVVNYYTAYMLDIEVIPSPTTQQIELTLENYVGLLRSASNRSYLSQKAFDPDDDSGGATLGALNNARTGPGAAVGISTGSGYSVRSEPMQVDRL